MTEAQNVKVSELGHLEASVKELRDLAWHFPPGSPDEHALTRAAEAVTQAQHRMANYAEMLETIRTKDGRTIQMLQFIFEGSGRSMRVIFDCPYQFVEENFARHLVATVSNVLPWAETAIAKESEAAYAQELSALRQQNARLRQDLAVVGLQKKEARTACKEMREQRDAAERHAAEKAAQAEQFLQRVGHLSNELTSAKLAGLEPPIMAVPVPRSVGVGNGHGEGRLRFRNRGPAFLYHPTTGQPIYPPWSEQSKDQGPPIVQGGRFA